MGQRMSKKSHIFLDKKKGVHGLRDASNSHASQVCARILMSIKKKRVTYCNIPIGYKKKNRYGQGKAIEIDPLDQ